MKTVKVRKKVKIFLESVMKTVFYAKRAPLNSDVGPLTLPIKVIKNQKSPQRVPYPKCERFGNAGQECDECSAKFSS